MISGRRIFWSCEGGGMGDLREDGCERWKDDICIDERECIGWMLGWWADL